VNPTSLTSITHAVLAAGTVADGVERELERARSLRLSGRPHHAVIAALSARTRCDDATGLPGVRRVALEAECALEAALAHLDTGDLDAGRRELDRAGIDGGVHLSPASRDDYRDALHLVRELTPHTA
jgi:hypothetical protein